MSRRLTKITIKRIERVTVFHQSFKRREMQSEKVNEEPHHVMGGLGWVGDGMGWCEAILDISQGFKEGRR